MKNKRIDKWMEFNKKRNEINKVKENKKNKNLYPILFCGKKYYKKNCDILFISYYHSKDSLLIDGGIYLTDGMIVYPDGRIYHEKENESIYHTHEEIKQLICFLKPMQNIIVLEAEDGLPLCFIYMISKDLYGINTGSLIDNPSTINEKGLYNMLTDKNMGNFKYYNLEDLNIPDFKIIMN